MSSITINVSKYLQAAGMNAYEFAPIVGMEATVVYAHARGRAMTQSTYWRYVISFESLGIKVDESYAPFEVTIKLRVLRELKGYSEADVALALGTIKQNVHHIEHNEYVDQSLMLGMLRLYGHTVASYEALDIDEEIKLRNDWYDKDQSIGTALRALRQKTGLTAKDVSIMLDRHIAHVSEIERSRKTADIDKIVELVDLYGMTVREFNAFRKIA